MFISDLDLPKSFWKDIKRIQQQHNNQMVEVTVGGGGRMDRDHVHDP